MACPAALHPAHAGPPFLDYMKPAELLLLKRFLKNGSNISCEGKNDTCSYEISYYRLTHRHKALQTLSRSEGLVRLLS